MILLLVTLGRRKGRYYPSTFVMTKDAYHLFKDYDLPHSADVMLVDSAARLGYRKLYSRQDVWAAWGSQFESLVGV